MQSEPILDIAHLGHLELLTPKFDESRRFFIDVLGMTESGRQGDSVYLRGWDDYERYSLKLTASKTSGMGHVAFRARSPQALERRAAALKDSGFDIGWTDGDLGHGPAFACQDPDGHRIELYFETEWYAAPPEFRPSLKNQAQRFPARGVNVRRLDHFNGLAVDIEANRKFFERYLGFRLTEQIVLNDGSEAAMWMTCTNKSYDFAYTRDHTGTKGRFHHLTYAVDSREEVLRAADIFLENGVYIETGPHKHAIQQTFFLYVYEPGGNRVEIANAGARLILAPDWKPIRWSEEERKKGQAWGLKTIESFHTYGTPPVEAAQAKVKLSPMPEEVLIQAINAYDYPPVTYDYVKERERRFAGMRELEHYLQNLLWATDAQSVKNGLSGVLYWGHYRAGYKDDRVRKFRATVTDKQLLQAVQVFQGLQGTGLMALRKIALPQFSYMAFLTKLRTFLDPERYCVLDSKVASLTLLAARLKRHPTYIPITTQNDRAYKWWVDNCLSLATRLQMQPGLRPVDVERGLFYLVDSGKRDVAEQLLSSGA